MDSGTERLPSLSEVSVHKGQPQLNPCVPVPKGFNHSYLGPKGVSCVPCTQDRQTQHLYYHSSVL